ncbi:Exosome complex exonuclease rrp6 [Paramyrothecium foliicola]|nr:Exosome complex exonuclease rrp6 [Paramyrothecium foliicola]
MTFYQFSVGFFGQHQKVALNQPSIRPSHPNSFAMESQRDFKSLQDGIQKSLVSSVKTANRIAAEDLSFQRTINPDVASQLDDKSSRLLALSTRLIQSSAKACAVNPVSLEDTDDIELRWRGIVDVVDSLLEKADTAMDEYTGLIKRKEPPTADLPSQPKKPKTPGKVIRSANIVKPQLRFELKPDNFPTTPWKPLLDSKPHASVSLEDSLVTFTDDKGEPQYKHPYETEINEMEYPASVLKSAKPIPYQPIEDSGAVWVDTFDGVLDMLKELKNAKEIAVDLEHHDFRTYYGLTCLMQVSTRDKDWIVDTLQPWRHKMQVLNEVFTDPSIVKVGALNGLVLASTFTYKIRYSMARRDLGLYVNGLFDTYFACKQLYSGRSLAFLLSKFVNFEADKKYQLADWRLRPIPEEMMYYARSDTHYLLYIYDHCRNDLIAASTEEQDRLKQALEESRKLSLSRHEHPGYDEHDGQGSRGWLSYVLSHSHLPLNGEQFAVFRALWKWRDVAARQEDESPYFLLGVNHLAEIARVNPPDAKALHSLLPPTARFARQHFQDIWDEIQATKSKGGPSLLQFLTSQAPAAVKGGMPRETKTTLQLPGMDADVKMARLQTSQLFGDMAISSRWENASAAHDGQESLIAFPWQRFVQDVTFEDEAAADTQSQPTVAEAPVAQAADSADQSMEEADVEFTLRRGTKRKSDAVEEDTPNSEESSDSDDEDGEEEDPVADPTEGIVDGVIPIMDEAADKKLSKKARKAQRKAEQQQQAEQDKAASREARAQQKALRKEKKSKEKQQTQKKYDAVPFDYSKAASVMRPTQAPAAPVQKAKKVFDPYSKTGENEIKGARKAPPIRGERSATFKK